MRGALLLAGGIIGEASIERRVEQETGWEAVDCGRHGAPASAPHLERSLACVLESAKLRRPFSVIVQFTAGGTRAGDGLLGGPGGVIYRFEYERGGTKFDLQPCAFPLVTPDDEHSGSLLPAGRRPEGLGPASVISSPCVRARSTLGRCGLVGRLSRCPGGGSA